MPEPGIEDVVEGLRAIVLTRIAVCMCEISFSGSRQMLAATVKMLKQMYKINV